MRESTEKKYKAMVDEYFNNGFNGTRAYLNQNKGSSEDSARAEFPKILAIPSIAEYVESKHKKAAQISSITHSDLVKTLKNWLQADATEFLTLSPNQVKKLPKEMRQLVTGFTHLKTTTGTGKNKVIVEKVKLTFVNKTQAATMLAKHVGFFGEHNYQKAIPLSDLSPAERKKKLDAYRKRLSIPQSKKD